MAGSILQQIDAQLDALFAGWNIYTTLICLVLGAYLIYPLFFYTEPDTHPMLLARQASNSYVRQPGESAIYRSLEVPHGYPLRSGLNVKDPGAQKWQAGRDGNLRDVWVQALKGPADSEESSGTPGKIISVLGKEEVIEHAFSEIMKDINSLGHYLQSHGGRRVAIYLPNSVELLVSFFATSLYGLTPVLVPFNQSVEFVAEVAKTTGIDCLVAAAGSLPLEGLLQLYPALKHVVWVAERSSRQMDWNEVPEGVGGQAEIAVWHEIVEEKRASASIEVPSDPSDGRLPNVVIVSNAAEGLEPLEFTQANFVAAIAAQLSPLPKAKRLGSSDVLLPLVPLTDQYTLVLTLAALFSNSSIALTPVSGHSVDYISAFRGITPTVLLASPQTLAKYHEDRTNSPGGILQKVTHWRQARPLAAGSMPKAASVGPKPRMIYTFERPGSDVKSLTSVQLSDLRVYTGAYIINAFTTASVAGAVCQTHVFDYRTGDQSAAEAPAHYGPPLSSVEIKLIDPPGRKSTDDHFTEGLLVIQGPAVAGGKSTTGHHMKITENNTLCYAQ